MSRILCLLLLCCSLPALAQPHMPGVELTVHYPGGTKDVDPQRDYYVELLTLAAEHAAPDYHITLRAVPGAIYQNRQLASLESGTLDVTWTMTSVEREQKFLAVYVPLMRGLLGYRVGMIKRFNQPLFDAVDTTQDLQRLRMLQGHDWPDSEILHANDFNIGVIANYEQIYQMLLEDKLHYFPRGVVEAFAELDQLKDVRLAIEKRHLIYYPTAIYYFTSRRRPEIADALKLGLERAWDDGSFNKVFLKYAQEKKALELVNPAYRIVHCLKNPLLPASVKEIKPKYWYWSSDPNYKVCQ